MIGTDFTIQVVAYRTRCGECKRTLSPGDTSLVSIRGGKVRKRVCSETCRIAFDDHYWQGKAFTREYDRTHSK